jgi:hypothetical protein
MTQSQNQETQDPQPPSDETQKAEQEQPVKQQKNKPYEFTGIEPYKHLMTIFTEVLKRLK